MAFLLAAEGLHGQQASAGPTGSDLSASRLITFNGTLKDASGLPRPGSLEITFTLYASEQGGEGLWQESQTVQADDQGKYTALLGITEKEGMPLEVFSTGTAKWLGIQVQGEDEQQRILLVAVPYALKAADADTVGGKPLSSFVLYENLTKEIEKRITPAMIVPQNAVPSAGGIGAATSTGSSAGSGQDRKLQTSGGTGSFDLIHESDSNTWVGLDAGHSISSGTNNSFFGNGAGYSNSTTGSNSFFGRNAGYFNVANENSFYGTEAGYNNTTGTSNAVFGFQAGRANQTGSNNSIFGYKAGLNNTSGTGGNSFFGFTAGQANTGGWYNAFFGYQAGSANTTTAWNAFFGTMAGKASTGEANSFFGEEAGVDNTSGGYNTFVGAAAGIGNTTESNNTFIGTWSKGRAGITNATALGYRSQVTQSHSLVLGSIKGVNSAPADTDVGIGTTAPASRLHIYSTMSYPTLRVESGQTGGGDLMLAGAGGSYQLYMEGADLRLWDTADRVTIKSGGNVGIGTTSPASSLHIYSTVSYPTLKVESSQAGGGDLMLAGAGGSYQLYMEGADLRFWDTADRVTIKSGGDVGIGTMSPKAKLQTDGGDIYVGSPGQGIILRSPDGLMCVRLTVNNAGALVSTPQACP